MAEEKQKPKAVKPKEAEAPVAEEHYEEVAEYKIGEGPPPLFLIVAFAIIVIWASISWIPFFGY